MAKRRADAVVVCEDSHHAAFARRFLMKQGYHRRRIRVEPHPHGRGAADQTVRQQYIRALRTYRARMVAHDVFVVIDGDRFGVSGRLRQLEAACRDAGIEDRASNEKVAVFVPTWCIETWLAYLDGEEVDESVKTYPSLSPPRKCKRHVNELDKMCRQGRLRNPAPDSLAAACHEYNTRIRESSPS